MHQLVVPKAIVRWISPLDFDDVLEIEQLSSEVPLKEDDLELYLAHSDVVCQLIDYSSQVLGYLIYQKAELALGVVRLCIHPSSRRRGLGTLLLNKVKEALYFDTQNRAIFGVYDTNLEGQLFLKNQGCIATKISKDNENIYVFEYKSPLELILKKAHYIYIPLDKAWTNHKYVLSDSLIKLHEEELRKTIKVSQYLEKLAKGDLNG